jgi:hypothetical protein
MKKKLTKLSILALALFAAPAIISCTEDPDETPSLSITPEQTSINFLADGTTTDNTTFVVSTNQDSWDAVASLSWVQVAKTATGFTVSASANTSGVAPAPATINVTAPNTTAIVINVTQGAGLEVSASSLTFPSKAVDSQTIVVSNASGYEVSDKPDWITIETNGSTLTVTAERYKVREPRTGAITIDAHSAGIVTVQVTQEAARAYYYTRPYGNIPIEHLSYNGRYAAGEYDITGVVVDLYNLADENYSGTTYSYETHPELTTGSNSLMLRGIADDGTPFARSVTADGRTTTKVVTSSPTFTPSYRPPFSTPYLVENGVESELPFPAEYRTGEESYQGILPDMISYDGKYIIGRINSNGSTWIAARWKRNSSNVYEFAEIGSPEEDNIYNADTYAWTQWTEANNITGLSASGKYLSGETREPAVSGGWGFPPPPPLVPAHDIPFRYNLETDTKTAINLSEVGLENSAKATHVTDDGTLFIAAPYSTVIRTPYVYEPGETGTTFAAWVLANYGQEIGDQIVQEEGGFVTAVSADKSVVIWVSYDTVGWQNHFIVVE